VIVIVPVVMVVPVAVVVRVPVVVGVAAVERAVVMVSREERADPQATPPDRAHEDADAERS
jgi:hypothetical protein